MTNLRKVLFASRIGYGMIDQGYFHTWGYNHGETEVPALYTIAVIEDLEGNTYEVQPGRFKFMPEEDEIKKMLIGGKTPEFIAIKLIGECDGDGGAITQLVIDLINKQK